MTPTKITDGKLRFDLIPWGAMEEVTKAFENGEKKYGTNNWAQGEGISWMKYFAAAIRHLIAWVQGKDKDEHSGINHLAHVCCCCLILLTYQLNKETYKNDDRTGL